jgi:hypothetical protein
MVLIPQGGGAFVSGEQGKVGGLAARNTDALRSVPIQSEPTT